MSIYKDNKGDTSQYTLTYSKLMELMIQAFYSSRDIDIVIQELLKAVVADTHMDRAYIFEKLKADDTVLTRTYRFNLAEPKTDLDPFAVVPIAKMDWYDKNLEKGIPRFVSDTTVTTAKNENQIRPSDVKSYVQLPIMIGGELVGLVGIANCRYPKHWPEDERRIYHDLSAFLSELIARKKLERQISHSNTVMTTILDSLDALVYVVRHGTNELLFANKKLQDFCDGRYALGKNCFEVLYPDISHTCRQCQHESLLDSHGNPTGKTISDDLYLEASNTWFDTTGTLIDWIDGQKAVLMVYRDVTARKRAEQELIQTNEIHNFALINANCFSWEINAETKTIIPSPAAKETLGYEASDLSGPAEQYFDKLQCVDKDFLIQHLDDYIEGRAGEFSIEHQLITASGKVKWLLVKGRFWDDDMNMLCGVSIDITEQKQYEQRLTERVYKDTLTGLYNIQYLTDNLLSFSGNEGKALGAMVLDIRSFKNINETFGHEYGDKILINVVKRLSMLVEDRFMLRVSGDRFLIICENSCEAEIEDLAKELLKSFQMPILIDSQSIQIDFKIGIALSSDGHEDMVSLLKDAEIALYEAKKKDLQDYQVLNDTLRTAFGNKVNMELELQGAIKNKDFTLYYQPKISVCDNSIIGAEALIRWDHAEYGMISPLDFITLAEETGQIMQIGDFVIAEVARQLRIWLDKGWELTVSLNVSAKQFLFPNLTKTIKKWLDRYSVPPEYMGIEITETIMISDFTDVNNILNNLRDYGVKVLLDDFGTGYSSMNYLSRVPIDTIKVDKAFLDNASADEKELSILKSIIILSHALDLSVTAEGVETENNWRS